MSTPTKIDDTFNLEDELQLLNKEIEETDELYKQLKSRYDRISSPSAGGMAKFVADEGKNLIALKSHKLSLIKDRIVAKKTIADMKLKSKDTDSNVSAKEILRMLADSTKVAKPSDHNNPSPSSTMSDDEIDRLLDDRYNECVEDGSIKVHREPDIKEYKLVVNVANNELLAVDDDYNLIDDIDLSKHDVAYDDELQVWFDSYTNTEVEAVELS